MPHFTLRAVATPVAGAVLALGPIGLVACSSRDKSADSTSAAGSIAPMTSTTASPATPDSTEMQNSPGMQGMQGAQGMQGMANMSGDADHDFLRMMSDHHKGLILLAHMTKERKDGGAAVADANKLDAKQDVELHKMRSMLEKNYKDAYAPKVIPEHEAMADGLKPKSGKEYEQTFYRDIIKHHQEAIKMIDDYLPKGKNAAIKQMAEKMKADQTKEIREFERKVSQSGG